MLKIGKRTKLNWIQKERKQIEQAYTNGLLRRKRSSESVASKSMMNVQGIEENIM